MVLKKENRLNLLGWLGGKVWGHTWFGGAFNGWLVHWTLLDPPFLGGRI